jgi:vacuolar-type H+-ATPase subunit I/STV1
MTFSVNDFSDLLQLLNTNPQLRDELRRVILTEEYLSLPKTIQELGKAQQAMAEAITALSMEVKALAEAQKRTEARVEELAEAQKRTEARLEEMSKALAETQRVVAQLAELYKGLSKDVAVLKGFMLEQRYRLSPSAFFWRGYRKLRALHPADLDGVDEAYARGEFSSEEWKALNKLDLLLLGVTGKGDDRREEYLAVEISWVIDTYDVERAHRRAELLRRLGYPVRAAVGGTSILHDAKLRADALEVLVALSDDEDEAQPVAD